MQLILGLIFALARAAHGGGYVGRLLSILVMALGFTIIHISTWGLYDAAIAGLIAFVGLYIGLVVGWGKGFAAITGRYSTTEKEFLPADYVGDFTHLMYGDAKLSGAAFLTIRSMLFLPLFIALAFYTGEYGFLFTGLSVLSMGVVYYLAGVVIEETKAVRLAEVVYFAIIGAALL